MKSRKFALRGGYLLIEPESESTIHVNCNGVMHVTEQLSVQCNEQHLQILEPIIITLKSALWTGGANYFIHIIARYEPNATDILHTWISEHFMEKEKDKKYFSHIPQLAINSAKEAIQYDNNLCGGYLCFYRIISDHVAYHEWVHQSAIQSIINLIRINYIKMSDEEIQAKLGPFL